MAIDDQRYKAKLTINSGEVAGSGDIADFPVLLTEDNLPSQMLDKDDGPAADTMAQPDGRVRDAKRPTGSRRNVDVAPGGWTVRNGTQRPDTRRKMITGAAARHGAPGSA